MPTITVGLIVRHPKKSEWGPGVVIAVTDQKATVRFRDLPADLATKTLDMHLAGLTVAEDQDDVKLRAKVRAKRAGRTTSPHQPQRGLPFDHALALFKARFPLLFKDPLYIEQERVYKLDAHKQLVAALGDGRGQRKLARGDTEFVRTAILRAMGAVNLTYPIEKAAFRDGIADEPSLVRYATALFAYVGGRPSAASEFDELVESVGKFPAELGNASPVKWPNITLLPYLWDPTRFMHMKPQPTKAIAAGLNFELMYDAFPRVETCDRLHALADELLNRLRPYGARDYVDAQSFIWKSYRLWDQ